MLPISILVTMLMSCASNGLRSRRQRQQRHCTSIRRKEAHLLSLSRPLKFQTQIYNCDWPDFHSWLLTGVAADVKSADIYCPHLHQIPFGGGRGGGGGVRVKGPKQLAGPGALIFLDTTDCILSSSTQLMKACRERASGMERCCRLLMVVS